MKLYTKMDIYIILYTKRILETSLISVNFLWKSKMHDKTFKSIFGLIVSHMASI